MAAPAPLELQGERGPGQQKLPDVNQDLVEGEARKSKEAPARTAFLRKREGRLASQRAVWVPPEPRRQVEPRSKRRRAHKLHKIDRSSKLPAAGESVGQGGHDAWKKSDGERVGNSLAQADSPISLQDGSSGNARLAVLSRAGTHKVELALREAAAGSPVPAAYVEATRTLPRLEAGTLALQLVTGKQGAAAAVHGGHGGASQAGSKRPSWDDRFWKAPSSVSSLMVPGVVAGQWLRKSIVDASLGASGSRGSKPPDPETGRSHGASPESSAAVTRMALAASVASRDFARQRRSPEDAHGETSRFCTGMNYSLGRCRVDQRCV